MSDLNIKCSVCDKPPGYECRWHFVRDVRAAEKERDDLRARLEVATTVARELWSQYQDACSYISPYVREKWNHDETLGKYADPEFAWLDNPAPSTETKP